ncbi:MAG TPA: transcription elongation factor, partial [Thermoanaerobaculia bacterium]|nr:transcription elongation factor [Thermoanaerobaculia bacterium]
TLGALRREDYRAASRGALARQAHSAATRRTRRERSAAGRKAARTKGPAGRSAAARKAARTRKAHRS